MEILVKIHQTATLTPNAVTPNADQVDPQTTGLIMELKSNDSQNVIQIREQNQMLFCISKFLGLLSGFLDL